MVFRAIGCSFDPFCSRYVHVTLITRKYARGVGGGGVLGGGADSVLSASLAGLGW